MNLLLIISVLLTIVVVIVTRSTGFPRDERIAQTQIQNMVIVALTAKSKLIFLMTCLSL